MISPVAGETNAHYKAEEQSEAYDRWFEETKKDLVRQAECDDSDGWTDDWLGREGCEPASVGESFAADVNRILSDNGENKLFRLQCLWHIAIDIWAENTVKGMVK